MKKIIAIIIIASALFTIAVSASAVESPGTETPVYAEITTVYGDRDGIISMTFDDGYYQTALLLQELFEEYDLYGSIMMTVKSASGQTQSYATTQRWSEIFDKGRLDPQNHSATHMDLSEKQPQNQNEATFKSEILDSKTALEGYFPEYDVIAYAIPYGRMSEAAHSYAIQHYYAIRSTEQGVQTLDPESSSKSGGWYKMYSPVVIYDYFDDEMQWDYIKKTIDNATNGWYAPIIHRVGDVTDTDLSLEMAHRMFSYISELNEDGKVWVTTYTNAIKYVRERQNSTISAWEEDGDLYVRITMSEYTDDGKALPLNIFNHPLTVKVEVPDSYGSINYTTGGVEYTATAFSEGAKNYVYMNVIPDGSAVKLRLDSTHTFGDWEKHDEQTHKRACISCGLFDYAEHTWDNGYVTTPSTHFKEGERTCNCTICDEDTTIPEPTNNEHVFNRTSINPIYKAEDATCQHANLYYHACPCGEKGTKTFEYGEKIDHEFGEWQITLEPTAESEGEKTRSCKYGCGTTETEPIPIIQASSDTQAPTAEAESFAPMAIIIICIAAASVVICIAMLITLKKRKK